MEKWTELDERNLFITRSNFMESKVDEVINEIGKISYGNISLKNYVETYKRKVFDLEELFKIHGLSYFGQERNEVTIRLAISNYLTTEMLEMSEMLNIIVDKLKGLNILYLNKTTSKLANIIIDRYVKAYQNKLEEISEFSLENNLKDILLEKLLDDRYYMYKEGDFVDFYNEMYMVMNKLGFEQTFDEIDEEMKPYVVKAEVAREKFASGETLKDQNGKVK